MGRGEHGNRDVPTVLVERLPHAEGLPLPDYATPGSAGADLCAAIDEPVGVHMGAVSLIPTGLKLAIPEGYEVQVRPRSGLALKAGLTLVNAPGTIDSDYRGEVSVIVTCVTEEPCIINRGDRIAQMIVAPVSQARWVAVPTLPETERGAGGFGHTGVHLEARTR
ncbi:MAG: dUTP diphosphatase [Planctomycetes bacterium]|nr:dUTP diphosphatase [Planctomycetota bacterium]